MKRRIKIKGWIAAVAAAAVLAAGCGVRTDTPVESGATAPEEITTAQTSGAEKPTHPEPSTIEPVSYTHLDVYKRQGLLRSVGQFHQIQVPHA